MEPELVAAHARLELTHWWFTARRTILDQVLSAVLPAGAPLVDLGCGTGGNAAHFARRWRVLGLDPSAQAIALAEARFPDVAFRCTATAAGATDHLARGGGMVLTDVLEHVADDAALLALAVDALPPGGPLVLTVPNDPVLWSPQDVAHGHFRRYTPASLRALLATQPLTLRLLSPFNSRLYPLIALARRLRRRARAEGDLAIPMGPANRVLHRIFAGEARALVAALDTGTAPFGRGVSLLAVAARQ